MIIWLCIILCGLFTFSMRFAPLSGLLPRDMPDLWVRAMRFVPIAVLSAIITPAILIADGTMIPLTENLRLPTAIAAALVAIWTRSVLVTLSFGMGCIWLFSWLAGG